MREQFLVEIGSGRELDDMVQLNTLFTAWVETVYQQAPLDRWSVIGTPALPSSAQLREAFLWSEYHTTGTGTGGDRDRLPSPGRGRAHHRTSVS